MRAVTFQSMRPHVVAGLVQARLAGFGAVRNENRVGAVLVAGPRLKVMPPRTGPDQVRAMLTAIASPPPSEHLGRSDLAGAIDRVARLSKRRGFVAVISDFAGDRWATPLARLGLRHDLLAIPSTTRATRRAADRPRRPGRPRDRPPA